MGGLGIGCLETWMFSDGMFGDGMLSDGMLSDGMFSDGTFCMRTWKRYVFVFNFSYFLYF